VARSDRPMSVSGAAPVRSRSRPGTAVRMVDPGLNPSLRFHSVGSIGVPAAFCGIARGLRFTRLPVSVELSRTVK
jgi:hypothetical protein